ncbi:P-loop containing nucleoside triphosphate hydrolase protein [Spinellus fusiger]|nr:P-loop containing nucleoside triphosphate hydrolase protein [Spinellus fusiger]
MPPKHTQKKPQEQWASERFFNQGPIVVNASTNATIQPARKYNSNDTTSYRQHISNPSMRWATDALESWGASANTPQTWGDTGQGAFGGWTEPSMPESHRFSHPEQVVFKLNTEIPDRPFFTEKVEYSTYRDRSIIPNPKDVMIEEQDILFQRKYQSKRLDPIFHIPINRVSGAYDSVDQYLYTHFELMRQDCLIPLQKAVQSYRKTTQIPLGSDSTEIHTETNIETSTETNTETTYPAPVNSFDFKLYEHVQLSALVFGPRQVVYRISFRLPFYAHVTWSQSKRLIEGSMVLLSKDHFKKDIKIATVVYRGDEPMRGSSRFEYMINIQLEADNEESPLGFGDPSSGQQDTYVMLEAPSAYFEAYRHILSVLKNTKAENLPFSQYLVNVSQESTLPCYASRKVAYDIHPSLPSKRDPQRTMAPLTQKWPTSNTGMDETQINALKTMMTNEVAIIQGPPGTGKTFVGTYGMRVLLKNFDESLGPIVCICQTNHALDQFLEHILKFDNRIIRIGSRSKSALIKDHTLYEVRRQGENPRGLWRLYKKRDGIVKLIKDIILQMYEEPCVRIDYLRKIKALTPRQLDCLMRLGETKADTRKPDSDSEDSEDDWVIGSNITAPKPSAPRPLGNTSKVASQWGGGNPNQPQVKEEPVNPVEIWLKDAIGYADSTEREISLASDIRNEFLEQQKGLLFNEDQDEEDLIDEEELKDIAYNFTEDVPEALYEKWPSINIGKDYISYSEQPDLQQRMGKRGRRTLNYKKIDTGFDTSQFNFFENTQVYEEPHYVLERWLKEDDLSMWPLPVRLKAHKRWEQQLREEQGETLKSLFLRYSQCNEEIHKIRLKHDATLCKGVRVIGLTSTAAAKYHDLLEEIKPKVIVVEEAAEMLESHIVTALTQSLQHLILIGDHQQLRPSTAVHDLGTKHFLNVSLFERLVNNNLPYSRLSFQRRMRPEIRCLIDPIYTHPPLHDHPDVHHLEPIRGMDMSLFFLSHNEPEGHMEDTASKFNAHEADMAARLSTYLLLQGYEPEDITIITMYSGQRSVIKKALRKERRLNVDPGLIHGMYILGNAKLLCEKSDLWNEIVSNLEEKPTHNIGLQLTLKCSQHNELTEVRWPVDFTAVEEGGCTKPCGQILDCAHQCTLKCHSYGHDLVRCQYPCHKVIQSCGHPCTRRCFEPCGSCLTPCKLRLPCGHEIERECGHIKRLMERPLSLRCDSCVNRV